MADGRLRHFLARFNGFQMLGRKSFHSGPLVLPLGLLRPSQIVRTPPTRPEACSPAALLGHHPSKANGPVGAIDRAWDHVTWLIHNDEWRGPCLTDTKKRAGPPKPVRALLPSWNLPDDVRGPHPLQIQGCCLALHQCKLPAEKLHAGTRHGREASIATQRGPSETPSLSQMMSWGGENSYMVALI